MAAGGGLVEHGLIAYALLIPSDRHQEDRYFTDLPVFEPIEPLRQHARVTADEDKREWRPDAGQPWCVQKLRFSQVQGYGFHVLLAERKRVADLVGEILKDELSGTHL